MIKIFPMSMDKNCPYPMGSFLFCRDLSTFHPDFEIATTISDADCVMFPQFSNNGGIHDTFDPVAADMVSNAKKPIVFMNDGGGVPNLWKASEMGSYIWGPWADYIKVFFSVECYDWHRNCLPCDPSAYVPYEFVGFVGAGLGMKPETEIVSFDAFRERKYDTYLSMNTYPPSREILFQFFTHGEVSWKYFIHNTSYLYHPWSDRIDWHGPGGYQSCRLGLCPDGATAKTERHHMIQPYSAMAVAEDTVEWAYPYVHGDNCLVMPYVACEGHNLGMDEEYYQNRHSFTKIDLNETVKILESWINNPYMLYDVYVRGWHHDQKYRIPNYFRNHIGETIKERI